MNAKAVIFDFDGVIVDSEKYWEEHENETYKQWAPDTWTNEAYETVTGMNVRDCFELLKQEHGITLSWEEYSVQVHKIIQMVYARSALMPGVRDCVTRLFDNQIPLAVASSSNTDCIQETLDRFELLKMFKAVVGSENLEPGQGKPRPTVYLKAAEAIGVLPGDCIAIEDSTNGVRAAVAAGMTCIGIRTELNPNQDLSDAHQVVERFDQIF